MTVLLEYLDVRFIPTMFLLYNSVAEILLVPKGTFTIIHQCIQRFSSYFHQWLTLLAGQQISHFLRELTLLTHRILIKFIANSVPEFTFICSLFVPNFKAIRVCIKKLQRFLQVCKKNNLSPPNPLKNKKRKKKHESLTTHIS